MGGRAPTTLTAVILRSRAQRGVSKDGCMRSCHPSRLAEEARTSCDNGEAGLRGDDGGAGTIAGPRNALRRASSFLAPAIASQPVPKAKDINSLLSELHGTAENTGISRMPFTSLVL